MKIDTHHIQTLRAATGAGMMEAKRALQEAEGDYEKAVAVLRKRSKTIADKKQERQTKNGVIGSYVHATHKVAALVALACESDFVAATDDFKALAHDLAMQVAATEPRYLAPRNVPVDVIEQEKEIYREQLRAEGKPQKMWDTIIVGKLEKYYREVCLVKQSFIKDETKTIEELIQEKILKLGENIQIRDIKRMAL